MAWRECKWILTQVSVLCFLLLQDNGAAGILADEMGKPTHLKRARAPAV